MDEGERDVQPVVASSKRARQSAAATIDNNDSDGATNVECGDGGECGDDGLEDMEDGNDDVFGGGSGGVNGLEEMKMPMTKLVVTVAVVAVVAVAVAWGKSRTDSEECSILPQ